MLDANRFANTAEAALLREHIAHDETARRALEPRVARARTAVHDTAVALQAARAAAASAHGILQQLRDAGKTLDTRLALARGLLHPIRQVPHDVLSLIFAQCVDGDTNVYVTRLTPFVLAAICRRWRNVALRDPTLWQAVVLDLHLVTDPAAELRWSHYLQVLSKRSASLPLDLYLACKSTGTTYSHNLWASLNALMPRANSLGVVSELDINKELVNLFGGSIDCLAALSITCYNLGGQAVALPFVSWAPMLRDIRVSGLGLLWSPESTIMPLVEGVAFETRQQLGFQDLLDMFYRFPKLDSLEIILADLTAATRVAARCENLTYLSLTADSCDIQVANSLAFPNLGIALINIDEIDPDAVVALLRNGLHTVHELHLWLTVDSYMIAGLDACTELQALRLVSTYGETAEQFFDALATPNSSGKWICPRLDSAHISNELSRDGVADAILRFASARCAGNPAATPALCPLHEVSLVYGSRLQADARRRDALETQLHGMLLQAPEE